MDGYGYFRTKRQLDCRFVNMGQVGHCTITKLKKNDGAGFPCYTIFFEYHSQNDYG